MPPGMKINFDETNMTEWEILLDGPDQSVYAVCLNVVCQGVRILSRC
jgi:ubiquitin-protein ligase